MFKSANQHPAGSEAAAGLTGGPAFSLESALDHPLAGYVILPAAGAAIGAATHPLHLVIGRLVSSSDGAIWPIIADRSGTDLPGRFAGFSGPIFWASARARFQALRWADFLDPPRWHRTRRLDSTVSHLTTAARSGCALAGRL